MRKIGSLAFAAGLCALASPGVASSAEVSSIQVDAVTVGNNITVSGILTLGSDATGATKVASDGSGDASAPRLGFDVGDAFVTPDLPGKKLTLRLNVNDGIPGIEGIGPAAGYVWPLSFDSKDNNAWLAAGTFVSGWPPKAEKWFELCSTNAGTYTCGNVVEGTMTASQVTWTIPFKNSSGPAWTANYGSIFEAGAAAPGVPGVIPWAVVSGGSTHDTVSEVSSYLIPGEVRVAIEPAGKEESKAVYFDSGVYNPATGAFSVVAPKPVSGSWTVFVKSCFGVLENLTCLRTSQPLTF